MIQGFVLQRIRLITVRPFFRFRSSMLQKSQRMIVILISTGTKNDFPP